MKEIEEKESQLASQQKKMIILEEENEEFVFQIDKYESQIKILKNNNVTGGQNSP